MAVSNALPPPSADTSSLPPILPKPVVVVAILVLLGFCGVQGYTLFGEWMALRRELDRGARTALVGFVNINPKINNAHHPIEYIRNEGEQTLLWAEWSDADGRHHWFHLPKGEIEGADFSKPIGKDRARAIDHPIVETSGGPRWERIHDDHPVVSHDTAGVTSAYPLKVMEKVLIVNDFVGGVPYIVAFSPKEAGPDSLSIYEATIDGKRINLGHSGYFLGSKPVFYDRETESLWKPTESGLQSFAGSRKGTLLKLIGHPAWISWSSWRTDHPDGRLLVGAHRP